MNYLAIAVATITAFVISSAYYAVLGKQLAATGSAAAAGRPPAWKIPLELARSLVLTATLAGFAAKLDITTWTGAVGLALAAWVGFAAVLYSGSVLWENVPWRLAAIHAGDWLVKTVAIAVIVSLWR
jgi:hypothetical protein